MNKCIWLAGLCLSLVAAGCHNKPEVKEEKETFTVTTPLRLDTTLTKTYVSQIRSVRNIEIRAQEKGYLQSILVDEGQSVRAGQLLFRIMPRIYEAELQKAQAEARASEIELQNAKTLADKNIVSKNEQSMAQAKLDEARAEVAMAKLHLSFTEIRAPFDGVIDRLPLKLGSLVDEGELLTTLSDNSQVYAYFNVSEPEYLDYETNKQNRANSKVNLLLANNQELKYSGNVETVEGEFEHETGNIAFRAKFPNPDRLLKHGETGKVEMQVPVRNALIIPQKASFEIQDKTFVFVVDDKGKVHARNISIINEMPDLYVVGNGIDSTEHILIEGVQKVKDDDIVQTKFVAPRQVFAGLKLHAE